MAYGSAYLPEGDISGMSASPAGYHDNGDRLNPKRFSDIFTGFYHWVKKDLPDPGAQNYAFESLGLTEFTPIGAGVAQRQMFNVLQPPSLFVNGQMLLTSGVGGVAAGQVIFQPLIDPYNNTYGGETVNG